MHQIKIKNLQQLKYTALLSLAVMLLISSSLCAQTLNKKSNNIHKASSPKSEIVFLESPWDSVLQKAKATQKYIFVDAYASWCGPCKMLKATTFRDKATADFFNQNFINVSIDMEKGEGPQLAVQWEMQSYPTLIIFDTAGKPVLGSIGFLKPEELISFGKKALEKKAG